MFKKARLAPCNDFNLIKNVILINLNGLCYKSVNAKGFAKRNLGKAPKMSIVDIVVGLVMINCMRDTCISGPVLSLVSYTYFWVFF